ncbi:hypothetical protein [Dactylosporangium sp. CS-033363]
MLIVIALPATPPALMPMIRPVELIGEPWARRHGQTGRRDWPASAHGRM